MKTANHNLPLESVDVLIIGNGPVGASMAAMLGRYGVQTLVVDKVHEVLLMPRAIALDNEALRILQLAGLEEDAFEKLVIPEVRMHCPLTGQFGRANTSGSLDGHPKLVTFYQPDLERAMRKQGESFEHVYSVGGIELLELSQDSEGVSAQLRLEDGRQQTIRARYLVGADGASSRVRCLIGLDFKGSTYAEDWLIVDTKGREGQAIDHVEFLCDHRRPTPHMPAPGGRERWEFMLRPGETREQMEDDSRIASLLKPWIPGDQLNIERKAVYRFHARCCERFQNGRVFLIGDAAHITPPFVGQGLVAGLRDAANLSWKLAWVLKGRASPAILDSYDQERRPHAREMIAMAKMMGRLVMPSNAPTAALVHGLMRVLRLLPPLRRLFEELDIKPKNLFKHGLFVAHHRAQRLRRGGLFPQGLVRHPDGRVAPSDEAMGVGMVLVGLGVDPRATLSPQLQAQWQQLGGSYLQVGLHGQKADASLPFVEDIGQRLLDGAFKPSLAVVRPDRIVMHSGAADQANEMVRVSMGLLSK